jgi:hypothetical protein
VNKQFLRLSGKSETRREITQGIAYETLVVVLVEAKHVELEKPTVSNLATTYGSQCTPSTRPAKNREKNKLNQSWNSRH